MTEFGPDFPNMDLIQLMDFITLITHMLLILLSLTALR